MSYYTEGAFAELIRIDSQAARFNRQYNSAIDTRKHELRDKAKDNKPVYWTDDINKVHVTKPAEFVVEQMPDALIEQAARAWLCGDKQAMANFFESACEVGFERAVEFLADIDAERGE